MAVPKKKTSVSRKGLRRAGQHHKLYANEQVTLCKDSGELTKKGYVSPGGYWKGKQVFEVKVRDEEDFEEETEA